VAEIPRHSSVADALTDNNNLDICQITAQAGCVCSAGYEEALLPFRLGTVKVTDVGLTGI